MNRAQFDGETLQCEQLILNQLYCDGRGSEDGGQAVESKRHGIGFRGIKGEAGEQMLPTGHRRIEPESKKNRRRHVRVRFRSFWRDFLWRLISVTKHAVRRLGSCAALLGPQFPARSLPTGLRFR